MGKKSIYADTICLWMKAPIFSLHVSNREWYAWQDSNLRPTD